jgi:beta-lactamase regulating signal transducer with metallopeptidase domain/HEAT repeat protein
VEQLLLVLMKATLVLAGGLLLTAALRRAPADARHLVWLVTVAALLALPVLAGWTPLRVDALAHLAATQAQPAPAEASAPASATAPREWSAHTERVSPPRAGVAPAAAPRRAWPLPAPRTTALVVWLTVAAALVARLAVGLLAVRRMVREARPLEGAGWEQVLCDAADRLGLADVPRLVSSEGTDVPFASGLWHGTIVLPGDADGWSAERRRLVLFHELAHLKRRDLASHLLGRVACAAYWFHPLAWIAARRLRAESERACDDLVLACGARPSSYASHLLEILTTARAAGAPQAVVAMARRAEFEGRMLAILDPAARRRVLGRAPSAVLATALGALFLCVAALAPSQAAPAPAVAHAAPAPSASPAEAVAADERPVISPREMARLEKEARAEVAHLTESERKHERERDREKEDENDEEQDSAKPTGDELALLTKVLQTDADASVRRSAAWALSDGGDGAGATALAHALTSDADASVREMAGWALADSSGDAVTQALAKAVQSDQSDDVRAIAAWALGQRPDAGAALLAAAADRSSAVRENAIWGLGHQDLEKAPAPVVAALRDDQAAVRLVAAWTLAQIGDPAAAPALRDAFKAEKDDEVRQGLFHALTRAGDRSPDVIAQMLEEKDPELRAKAVAALSRREGLGPWPWPRPDPRPFP